jgi:D-alanine-D-alanine ligase
MNVAVCFNRVPAKLRQGEAGDRISEEGAEAEARAVTKALKQLGHAAALLPVGKDIDKLIEKLRATPGQILFNLCEGFWGDSRKELHVAALFDLLGLAYSGSAPLCLGLTQDKVRTKDILVRHGLPTPKYILVKMGEQIPKTKDLSYPLFVKPRFEDASLGITSDSLVETEAALKKRIQYIHDTYRQGALVEEYIDGREINAAILGNGPFEVLPLSEIRFLPGLRHAIVSYDGKWLEDSPEYTRTEPVCPAPLKAKEAFLVKDVALRAYKLLECRDYARVDIRLRGDVPYILEVNANPDISPTAGLANAARAAGIAYPKLIERIVAMTLKRKELLDAQP